MLNKTLDKPRPNPFRDIIKFARASIAERRQEAGTEVEINGCRVALLEMTRGDAAPTLEDWTLALEDGPNEDLWEYLRCPGSYFHARTELGELQSFTFRFHAEPDGAIIARGTCHPATETPAGSYLTSWEITLADAAFRIDPEDEETRLKMLSQLALPLGKRETISYLAKVPADAVGAMARAAASAEFYPLPAKVEPTLMPEETPSPET